jgi:hypothetical protein
VQPVPIPDDRIWVRDDGQPVRRQTLGAPRGAEDHVRPVEVLVEDAGAPLPGQQYHVLLALEEGDLERLVVDGHVWLTMWTAVVPFALTVPGQEQVDRLLAYRVTRPDGSVEVLDADNVELVYRPDLEAP